MAELDAVVVYNPTNEDFTQEYNGEPYTLPANDSKAFAKFVAFHVAKHLSSKLIEKSVTKKEKKEKRFLVPQLLTYDNPTRRITLFKILHDVDLVKEVINAYPFKGFMGEMSEYENFVENFGKEKEKQTIDNKSKKSATSSAKEEASTS